MEPRACNRFGAAQFAELETLHWPLVRQHAPVVGQGFGEHTLPGPLLLLPAAHVVPLTYRQAAVVVLQHALTVFGHRFCAVQAVPTFWKRFGAVHAAEDTTWHVPSGRQHAPLPTWMLYKQMSSSHTPVAATESSEDMLNRSITDWPAVAGITAVCCSHVRKLPEKACWPAIGLKNAVEIVALYPLVRQAAAPILANVAPPSKLASTVHPSKVASVAYEARKSRMRFPAAVTGGSVRNWVNVPSWSFVNAELGAELEDVVTTAQGVGGVAPGADPGTTDWLQPAGSEPTGVVSNDSHLLGQTFPAAQLTPIPMKKPGDVH